MTTACQSWSRKNNADKSKNAYVDPNTIADEEKKYIELEKIQEKQYAI